MCPRSEVELVEAALGGDVDSFGELYRRHYAAMVGLARCVLHDRHSAEDAAQEAFAVACRDLGRLRHADRFAGWLSGICRKVASRMARSCPTAVASPDVPAPVVDGAERERAQSLRIVVERLPRRAREVVMLHYFTGRTHKQIAEVLGISAQAVHGRLTRARRTIAEELRRLGIDGREP